MSTQLSLRLPEDLMERLEATARRHRRSRSEIVRMAIEQFLDTEFTERPIERVRDLLGAVETGIPDLGERHREYLLKRLSRGR